MRLFEHGWLIVLSIAVAVILSIMRAPFEPPTWTDLFRPDWLTLVIFYWKIRFTEKINLYLVWLFGFFVDVLMNEPLGTNSLCYIILLFTCHQIANNLSRRQHTKVLILLMALLCGLTTCKALILLFAYDVPLDVTSIVARIVSSFCFWFPTYLLLDRLSNRFLESQ